MDYGFLWISWNPSWPWCHPWSIQIVDWRGWFSSQNSDSNCHQNWFSPWLANWGLSTATWGCIPIIKWFITIYIYIYVLYIYIYMYYIYIYVLYIYMYYIYMYYIYIIYMYYIYVLYICIIYICIIYIYMYIYKYYNISKKNSHQTHGIPQDM